MEKRLLRIHMLHRQLELHERFMLHPRVLDVLEALIGPDVLAMQTMLFLKAPGAEGQGYHQDSYYIPTFPDSLCGAWLALDRADEENGCMWMTTGSKHEPIYPPTEGYGYGQRELGDIITVSQRGRDSNDDEDATNGLKPIAAKYAGQEYACVMEPGDVAFFGGHVLHRSLTNRSHRPDAPLVRQPLLQRPQFHALGWRQSGTYSGAGQYHPALRPAPFRNALRRQPSRNVPRRRGRDCRHDDGRQGRRHGSRNRPI